MRACREGGEPYDIGRDLQDRSDETADLALDHVSGEYAITAGPMTDSVAPAGSDSERSLTFAEISRGTEFLRITGVPHRISDR